MATSNLSVPILSTVSAHPPTGSASISVAPRVAPQLRGKLSRVTWINDSSTGFPAQPHPLRKPARSAPILTLTARHRTALFTDNPFYPPLSSPGSAAAPSRWWTREKPICKMSPLFNLRLCSERWTFPTQKLPDSRRLQAPLPDPTYTESKKAIFLLSIKRQQLSWEITEEWFN